MKIKLSVLMVAAVTIFIILFAGAVSAALELKAINIPTSATHGQGVSIAFTLTNTGAAQTELVWSGIPSIGTWTNLNSLPNSIGANTSIPFTGVINVPKYQSGTINANLKVDSKEGESDTLDSALSIPITRSPSLSLTEQKPLTVSQDAEITVTNTGNVALTGAVLSATGNIEVTFSNKDLSLVPGQIVTGIIVKATNLASLEFGSNSAAISAKDTNENVVSNVLSYTIFTGFCKQGEKGNLTINDVNIDTSGSDEEVWKPLDEITVEVEVENEGDDRIRDIVVELALFNSEGKNIANDLDFSNTDEEKIKLGTLNDGDQETVTFSFKVPADFNDVGNLKLALKAYSKDLGEANECTDRSGDLSDDIFQDVELDREDDEGKFIAFDSIKVEPSEAVCGDSVRISSKIFNVGDEDQDQVKIRLVNNKLNVDLSREIKNDVNQGDSENVEFEFVVPQTATDGSYILELSSEYDYRSGTYRESSDDATKIPFKVFGCKITGGDKPTSKSIAISASLESDAKSGEELIVVTTITNLGNTQADFVVTASGFETWAKLSEISERLINLKAGETKEVTVRLNVEPDAEGENTFALEVRSGDKLETREIAVNIEKSATSPGFNLDLGGNSLIWIIGIINVVLIVLIIVVAARISRK